MYLVGPTVAKLLFHAFVVLVGVLILSGAANTAILGANGVLNRLCETRVLTSWFQRPHRRYGTTYRTINLITLLQVLTIVLSRGNFYVLAPCTRLASSGVSRSMASRSHPALQITGTPRMESARQPEAWKS